MQHWNVLLGVPRGLEYTWTGSNFFKRWLNVNPTFCLFTALSHLHEANGNISFGNVELSINKHLVKIRVSLVQKGMEDKIKSWLKRRDVEVMGQNSWRKRMRKEETDEWVILRLRVSPKNHVIATCQACHRELPGVSSLDHADGYTNEELKRSLF